VTTRLPSAAAVLPETAESPALRPETDTPTFSDGRK